MSVSVIIVNYNTGAMLNNVVVAAFKNHSVSEIIVVDNNSQDNSMELLQNQQLLTKHFRKQNHGFASSCNYGAGKAKSEYLLFLNPDCFVGKSSIDNLLTDLKNHENSAIIGCRVNNADGSEQRASRRRLPTFWRAFKTFSKLEKLVPTCKCFTGVNLNHQPIPVTTKQVEAISGALILMKSKVFKQIKGFDDKFPLHFEDLDLFKRTQDNGYEILFNPNVQVVHHQGLSSQSNPQVAELKKQGLKRYFHKHSSPLSSFFINLLTKFS